MAALPPPLAASISAPTTYRQYYQSLRDPSNGASQHLYKGHHPTTGETAAELLNRTVSSSNHFPQLHLACLQLPDNSIRVLAVHRPTCYEANLLKPPSPWNNCIIAFVGDYNNTTRFIKTVIFPANSFDITAAQTVPPAATMAAQFAATNNDTVGPPNSGNADTQDIATRMLVPVPPLYVDMVLGRQFSTRQLWDKLGTAIITDGHLNSCALLLNLILLACTRRTNPISAPLNHIGSLSTAFPPVADDEFIARHRHDILTRDMPAPPLPTATLRQTTTCSTSPAPFAVNTPTNGLLTSTTHRRQAI